MGAREILRESDAGAGASLHRSHARESRATALYNELDPYTVEWMRRLERAGHIAAGDVDVRSISDLLPGDVRTYRQFHAFSGLGGWSHALRLAGWPDDRSVWTGSCPCQPFSQAGSRAGFADERHLWPAWFKLIRECLPDVIFGEQVSSTDALSWFDAVSADLEGEGYAIGALDTCAASVGSPHRRQRLYFVALRPAHYDAARLAPPRYDAARRGASDNGPVGYACRDGDLEFVRELRRHEGEHEVGPTNSDYTPEFASSAGDPGPVNGFWRPADWLPCTDGKSRPIEPGTFPLAPRLPGDVGRLRAYGNAICTSQAATFVASVMDLLDEID